MKKLILFTFTAIMICSLNVTAQVTNYEFRDSIGVYNEIVGDTIAGATHTSQDPGNLNDVTYGPFALPFIFTFNCNDYTSYFVNTNGYITLGATAPAVANYIPISGSESYEGAISAFGIDLIGVFGTTIDFSGVTNVLSDVRNFKGVVVGAHITAATGIPADTYITGFDEGLGTITISNPTTDIIVNDLVIQIASGSIVSKTEGITPNRVNTIQFKNFRQYIIIGTDDNFNFQIKLFESTYTGGGEIKVVYGDMYKNPAVVTSVFGQIGLRGTHNTEWNSRTNSITLDWGTSTPGLSNAATSELSSTVFPVSGLTYIWEGPCGVLPVEMSSFVSVVNGSNVTLSWTTTSEKNNSGFEIERRAVNSQWITAGTVQGNGTTITPVNYSFTDRGLSSGVYDYRLKQTDFNGNFKYYSLNSEVIVGIPINFSLSQNYPNPFNPSTKINYDLPFDGKVTLKIFDISGREVSTLINEFKTAGYYTIDFKADNLSSGIYLYKLTSNSQVLTRKMLIVK